MQAKKLGISSLQLLMRLVLASDSNGSDEAAHTILKVEETDAEAENVIRAVGNTR